MRLPVVLLLAAGLPGGWTLGQPARYPLEYLRDDPTPEPPPEGAALMRQVRARLPGSPLRMSGFIRTRSGGGDRDRGVVSTLRFGDPVPNVRFELSDRFGQPLTTLYVRWPAGGPVYEWVDGDGKPLPDPEPTEEIAGTGLTASDLALGFLWWRGAEVAGRDRIRARPTWVVSIPAPEEYGEVERVKLWVDRKALFIVRARLLGAEDNLLKEIEVDSIKEIREDFWIVKDLLIRDRVADRRIGIRFEEVEELEE